MDGKLINDPINLKEGVYPLVDAEQGPVMYVEVTKTHFILRDTAGTMIMNIARYLIPIIRRMHVG